jgi:hypothetical protein
MQAIEGEASTRFSMLSGHQFKVYTNEAASAHSGEGDIRTGAHSITISPSGTTVESKPGQTLQTTPYSPRLEISAELLIDDVESLREGMRPGTPEPITDTPVSEASPTTLKRWGSKRQKAAQKLLLDEELEQGMGLLMGGSRNNLAAGGNSFSDKNLTQPPSARRRPARSVTVSTGLGLDSSRVASFSQASTARRLPARSNTINMGMGTQDRESFVEGPPSHFSRRGRRVSSVAPTSTIPITG